MVTYPETIYDQLQLFYDVIYSINLKMIRDVRLYSVIMGPTSGCSCHVTTGWRTVKPRPFTLCGAFMRSTMGNLSHLIFVK